MQGSMKCPNHEIHENVYPLPDNCVIYFSKYPRAHARGTQCSFDKLNSALQKIEFLEAP